MSILVAECNRFASFDRLFCVYCMKYTRAHTLYVVSIVSNSTSIKQCGLIHFFFSILINWSDLPQKFTDRRQMSLISTSRSVISAVRFVILFYFNAAPFHFKQNIWNIIIVLRKM